MRGCFFLCGLAGAVHAGGPPLPPLDLGGVREEHVMIPMRDGVRLSGWLYRPAGGRKWPVIFQQVYADIANASSRKIAADLARGGFAVASVNFRGAHQSEGAYVGYRALGWGELQDGYDVCEWLAVQAWSTGKIGTFGASQGGFAQNFLAVVDTGLSLFHEGYRKGGTTRPLRFATFAAHCRNAADNATLLQAWDRHPDYSDYWRAEDSSLHFAAMDVPCFTLGSWYDSMVEGSVQSFIGRQHQGGPQSRGRQRLVLGPWLHGSVNKTSRVGELAYPPNAVWPVMEHMTRWFNHWLKGESNGEMGGAPVRYYVMGAVGEPGAPGNFWREAADWPPRSSPTRIYLREGGKLTDAVPARAASRTTFMSDPLHPMEIAGPGFPGARDARVFESQEQVRIWTSEPFDEPTEWTGEVKAEIWLSSTAPDTDLILRVSDVYPDGRSILIMEYPQRARYRDGFDRQRLLVPGEPARLSWHIGWTSLILSKGHRIRVALSSTGAPYYEPNSQTGAAQTVDWLKSVRLADNTIWHDAAHPSCIVVPAARRPPR